MAYILLLIIHIACGSIALLCVPVALLTAKGRANHVRAGRVYGVAMTGVFVTALPLAMITANLFLLLVAVFSFYMVFAGWRFARNHRGQPQWVDWAAAAIMTLTGLGMWGYSAALGLSGDPQWMTMAVYGAVYWTGRCAVSPGYVIKEASRARLFTTEATCRIVNESLQIHGGAGLERGSHIERLYREVRSLTIYEGTSEMQRRTIARQSAGERDPRQGRRESRFPRRR